MRLIFIRHGDPDYSIDSLTTKGWIEAELLSKRTSKWDVKDFYCSPLGRARDTASFTLKKMNREAIICDWLKEFYIPVKDPVTGGDRIPWDFMPSYWTKEAKLYHKDEWFHAPIMETGNVKESYEKVCRSFDDLLDTYGYKREGGVYKTAKGNNETIVFFCHLGLICVLMSHLLGITPPQLWQGFFLAPSSVTVLTSEERIPGEAYFRCQVLGDTKHLSDGGELISGSGYFADIFQD